MPRDGLQQYAPPPGTNGITNYTIESTKYNGFVADVTQDLNLPRPIVAGGTGANNAHDAMIALSGEIAKQVVTNYDSFAWVNGSFYSAAGATSAPNPTNRFAGIYYANADDSYATVEARDQTTGIRYVRNKVAGVWGAWAQGAGSVADLDAAYVNVAGDTMTGALAISSAIASTSPTTGALTVAGGVGVNGAVNVGGTLSASGALSAGAKLNVVGFAGGTVATGAVALADANIVLYAGAPAANWAGMGADGSGQMWFRTGITGSPVPAMYIDTAQVVHFTNPPIGLGVAAGAKIVRVQKITASGTYTPNANLLFARVCLVAGGGGGGSATAATSFYTSGGGGGAGCYAERWLTAAQIGASQSVTIGAAGAGGSPGSGGGAGGSSAFGALLTVNAGAGGSLGSSGGIGTGGTGATGVGGADVSVSGQSGGNGFYSSLAGPAFPGGEGGASLMGFGGRGSTAGGGGVSSGLAATGPGGGGAGASSNNQNAANPPGSAGFRGECWVFEFCSQ